MFGEMQPLDVEGRIEKLRGTVRRLGEIASRALGSDNKLDGELKRLLSDAEINLDILWCATCPDCKEALSDEDAASEQAMQDRAEDCAEEIEFLPENREY